MRRIKKWINLINKIIYSFINLFTNSKRNLALDEINLQVSNQIEDLYERTSELEKIAKDMQACLFEITLRTPDVIDIGKDSEPIVHQIRELVRPQKYKIANLEFFGNEFDGGYYINSVFGKKINLISIGIGDNYSFDIEVAKRGGIVHMYDGTIKKIIDLPKNMTFIEKNVGNDVINGEIKLSSVVNNFLESLSSLDDVKVMKIDIEGSEWEIFDKFDFGGIKNFETLVVEFHDVNKNLKSHEKQKIMIDVFGNINNYFKAIYFSPNNWSPVIKSGNQLLPNTFEIVYTNREQYVNESIPEHESAEKYDKPKNNPFRPSLGRFFV